MSEINTVTFDLELNVTEAEAEIRRIQGVLQGYLGLLQRLGLSPEISRAISQLQALIRVVNSARRALLAFQAARAAAGDPIAIAQLILQAGLLAADVADVTDIRRPQP